MANTKKYVSLDKLGLYDDKIKDVIANADTATLNSAKDYAKTYADGLATNYDAAGSAATALADAKTYADGKDSAIQAAHQAGTDAATAASVADGKAVKAQGDVDALKTYVGTIPSTATATDIVGYVQEKTSGIATEGAMTELTGRVSKNETDIGNIVKDYLKAADKTELEGKITAVETAVATEKSRAEGVESGLRTDINTVMGDYLKKSDKDELQGNIDTLTGVVETLRDGIDAEKVDGVKDLIDYVEEHGAEVTGMKEDIAGNAEAIEGVAGRVGTLEGKMTTVEGAVATKAEKTYVDEQVQALQGADTGLGNRITALENKFGGAEGSVEDMIADAKAEAIASATGTAAADATSKANAAEAAAKGYTDSEIDKVEATISTLTETVGTKAAQSEVNTISGKVGTLETKVGTLETEMDAVEALAAAADAAAKANASAIALKASQADLDAVSGRVTTLETWHSNFVECSQEDINELFN